MRVMSHDMYMENMQCDNCPQLRALEEKVALMQDAIERLEAVISGLRTSNEEKDARIRELEIALQEKDSGDGKGGPPPFVKPPRHRERQRPRGGRKGHKGHGRQVCDTIDEEKELTLDACPSCGGALEDMEEKTERHIKEDLVIRKVTTRYGVHHYRCAACGKECRAPYKEEFIGENAKNLALLLHYYEGVPFAKITEVYDWFGLRVTPGAICNWARNKSESVEDIVARIKSGAKESRRVNVDETGWRRDGKNCYLWVFTYEGGTYFEIAPTRSSHVVEEVLGKQYDGVLLSDFLGAYNKIESKKQRCLVHLLRDMKDFKGVVASEKHFFADTIMVMLKRARKLLKNKDILGVDRFLHRVSLLKRDFLGFLDILFEDKDCARLRKRLLRHRDEIWTFVEEDVAWHNNDAEREIRRPVTLRKISGGNRSDAGARAQGALMSFIHTIKANGLNLLNTFAHPLTLTFNSS